MLFAMLSVTSESGEKHQNADMIRPRAISARRLNSGCCAPFVASCMTLSRPGSGSRNGRSRAPSSQKKPSFQELLKQLQMKRAESEPINLKTKQAGAKTQGRQPAASSGSTTTQPQESRRQVVLKASNQMSDLSPQGADHRVALKEANQVSDEPTQDTKTASSSKAERAPHDPDSSSKPLPPGNFSTP